MTTKKKKTKDVTKKSDSVSTYILLDRSQSMGVRWDEALGSVNAYVHELSKQKGLDAAITVATFDFHGGMQFDLVRKDVAPSDYKSLTRQDADPRGSTPLYDALGRMVSLAEKNDDKKTVIVVMTDGEENSSREVTREAAGKLIEACKKKDWQVVFLGADFDAFAQSASVGVAAVQTMSMSTGNYAAALRGVAGQTVNYATGVTASMSFSDEDRAKAVNKK